jgi:hypothetical protein
MKKLVFSVLSAGMLFAQAEAHFKFTAPGPITVAGTKLKQGEYKVDVEGSEATFKMDGKSFKVPATIQMEGRAYKDTSIDATNSNVRAIHVGGTVISVLFAGAPAGN